MAVDYFLKIDGIEGESQDKTHKNEIQLLSFNWGGTQTSSVAYGGGGGAGKVSLTDFSVVKYYDKASPKLFQALCDGSHIKNCILTARKAGKTQQEYIKLTLTDILVTSSHVSASDENPTESVSFSYSQIATDYRAQNADGTSSTAATMKYNLKTNSSS